MASHRGEQWRCPKRMRERVWSRQIERNATVRRDVARSQCHSCLAARAQTHAAS